MIATVKYAEIMGYGLKVEGSDNCPCTESDCDKPGRWTVVVTKGLGTSVSQVDFPTRDEAVSHWTDLCCRHVRGTSTSEETNGTHRVTMEMDMGLEGLDDVPKLTQLKVAMLEQAMRDAVGEYLQRRNMYADTSYDNALRYVEGRYPARSKEAHQSKAETSHARALLIQQFLRAVHSATFTELLEPVLEDVQ